MTTNQRVDNSDLTTQPLFTEEFMESFYETLGATDTTNDTLQFGMVTNYHLLQHDEERQGVKNTSDNRTMKKYISVSESQDNY